MTANTASLRANHSFWHLMAFYDDITLVDKRRATDNIYKDFCKAFHPTKHLCL